ncbi:MAG TPA: hypothetical protein VLM85_33120 [Polyangiaceae bacterium]|nr:hypothetical protein [Polyangiaceae bacterium]
MSNRQWLKDLATTEKGTWMTAVLPAHLDGLHRLETRHTVYVFEDGECTEVVRRGAPEEDRETAMVGMRIVGWLLEVEGTRRLVGTWRPGARAILWRAPRVGERESKIALTSPSFGFVRCEPDDDEWDLVTTEYDPRARPSLPPRPTATGSFARLGSPQPPA